MSFFNEAYYIQSKLAQLNAEGFTDNEGKQYTEDSLRATIEANGMTLEEHYIRYHTKEHTSANPYFNTMEYLEAKAKQLNSINKNGKSDWTADDVEETFTNAGLTAEQHYLKFGCKETDANGKFINPSNAFDANAYAEAKLAQLMLYDPDTYAGWTAYTVNQSIVDAGMTLLEHYEKYGSHESEAYNIDMLQTVPVSERVANDTLRDAMGENVPSNYNKPLETLGNITSVNADAVLKPFDIGSDLAETPDSPVPTPFDVEYVPVPNGGLEDTPSSPVVLVTSEVMNKTGAIVDTVKQYGKLFVSHNGLTEISTAYRVDDNGAVTEEILQQKTENLLTGETKVETAVSGGDTLFSLVKYEWSYQEESKDWYSLTLTNLNLPVCINAVDDDQNDEGNVLEFISGERTIFSSQANVSSIDFNDPARSVSLSGSTGLDLDITNANSNVSITLTENASDTLSVSTVSTAEEGPKITGVLEENDEISGSFNFNVGENNILTFTNCGFRLEEDGYVATGTQLNTEASLGGDISLLGGKLALTNKIDIHDVTNTSGSMEFTLEEGTVRGYVTAAEQGASYTFKTSNADIELSASHNSSNADTLFLTKAVLTDNNVSSECPNIANFGDEDKVVLKGFDGIHAASKATPFDVEQISSGRLYYIEEEGNETKSADDISTLMSGIASGTKIALVDITADGTSANVFYVQSSSSVEDLIEVQQAAQIVGIDISENNFSAIAY